MAIVAQDSLAAEGEGQEARSDRQDTPGKSLSTRLTLSIEKHLPHLTPDERADKLNRRIFRIKTGLPPGSLMFAVTLITAVMGLVGLLVVGDYVVGAALCCVAFACHAQYQRVRERHKVVTRRRIEFQRRLEEWARGHESPTLRRLLEANQLELEHVYLAAAQGQADALGRRYGLYEKQVSMEWFDTDAEAGEGEREQIEEMSRLLPGASFRVARLRAGRAALHGELTLVGVDAEMEPLGPVTIWYYVGAPRWSAEERARH